MGRRWVEKNHVGWERGEGGGGAGGRCFQKSDTARTVRKDRISLFMRVIDKQVVVFLLLFFLPPSLAVLVWTAQMCTGRKLAFVR